MGQSPSSSNYNIVKKGLPLIQGNLDICNGITKPRMWTTEITKESKINDIILTVRAPVGDIAKSTINACIGRGVCALRIHNKLHNEFLYQYLLYYKKKWSAIEQGSTFTSVSHNNIANVAIPEITEKLLNDIEILSMYDNKIIIEESYLKRVIAQKQYLLSQMFI